MVCHNFENKEFQHFKLLVAEWTNADAVRGEKCSFLHKFTKKENVTFLKHFSIHFSLR